MTITTAIAAPVAVVRHEAWTYDKGTKAERTVTVVAHRRGDGTFAGGRFGNGARTGRRSS